MSPVVRADGTPPGLVTFIEVATPSINGVTDPPDDAEEDGTLLNTGDARVDNVVFQSNS